MLEPGNNALLPEIPSKRYFTIGEVSELCDVKPHVLRYWEQEFNQLKPVKRRGNRRYYQRQDVLMIRQIRGLLYEQGYTIGGARLKLGEQKQQEVVQSASHAARIPVQTMVVDDVDMVPVLIHNMLVDLEQIVEILAL